MIRLPRRYLRYGAFLIFVMLLISLYRISIDMRSGLGIKHLFIVWKDESPVNLEKLHATLETLDRQRQIITGIGLVSCFRLGHFIEWCPIERALHHHSTNMPCSRKLVKKDISGSTTFLRGLSPVSQYLYYDTLTVEELDTYILSRQNTGTEIHVRAMREPRSIQLRTKIPQDGLLIEFDNPFGGWDDGRDYVSDMDLLFGDDCTDPREGWILHKGSPVTQKNGVFVSSKQFKSLLQIDTPQLTFGSSNKFKIVQLADLHLGVGSGVCRDEFPVHETCYADPKTVEFIGKVLDFEEPQLVVFTGDQIMGELSREDSASALLKAVAPAIERRIPYAMVWGNHDDEGSMSRRELSEYVSRLPYSLFQMGPLDKNDKSFGMGNYKLSIKNQDGEDAAALYFLDSHKYSSNAKIYPGYDWIKESQWIYMRDLAAKNSDNSKKLSMAFFHIPIPEYLDMYSTRDEAENPLVGNFKEGITAPKYNSGGLSFLHEMGVSAVSVGHDHCNDYCLLDDSISSKLEDKIWLCYGGGAGEGGYAGYGGTERRIRIFEIDNTKKEILTWKRLQGSPEDFFDRQVLVSNSVPNAA
ncbi:LAMI_0C05028g1_1 [Lachancea mirantina]|uniref:LAMI_0C05028g1_1 n=1 Tax=Lachancea mirantina TaxID=1230905 RepID=A0A1G4J2I5_9SACH|nr:LAMI_0C05028g1_1 [Lachancea mirantina]